MMPVYKRNYLAYFYTYFIIQVIFIYVNVYLPVYFFNVLKVNRIELAFVQIFAYLALFIRPFIAIYFDKKTQIIKPLIIVCSIGTLFSFILFIFSLNLLVIFGIFLGINFTCASVIRVAIDKMIVDFSPDEKSKDRNALYMQLGGISGALFPNIIFIIIFTDLHSLPTWNQFFLIGIFSVFPVIFISFLLKFKTEPFKNVNELNEKEIKKKSIILLGIILFLFYSERIYEYPVEPWILNKFGEQYFSILAIFVAIIIVLNALGVILAGIFSNKFDRIKILIISSLAYGILLIIAPFTDMITFFILFGIMQLFSGFIVVNLISLMIKYSQNKVVYYQIMATFAILSVVIFVPLGTYLSALIATELLIVFAGVLKIVSIIPIFLLIDKNKKK